MNSVEARLQKLEDRMEIIDLLSGYGPAVDRGDSSHLAMMWKEDGKYTYGVNDPHGGVLEGQEVPDLVDLPGHRQYMEKGCAHVLTTPKVELTGESAVAINHSLLLVHERGRWVVDRTSANRWELRKIDGRWLVTNRTNALLDGAPLSYGLFAI